MDRRELIKLITLTTGAALIGGEFILSGCKNPAAGNGIAFTDKDISLLDEIAETILPRTTTPGAKDAGVGRFMTTMVNDCYTAINQKAFQDGMKEVDNRSKKSFSVSYEKATAQQRIELLTLLEKEAKEYSEKRKQHNEAEKEKEKNTPGYKKVEMPNHYYTMLKQLTLQGYFTSEAALTKAFDYQPIPGKYIGSYPYKKGDKLFV